MSVILRVLGFLLRCEQGASTEFEEDDVICAGWRLEVGLKRTNPAMAVAAIPGCGVSQALSTRNSHEGLRRVAAPAFCTAVLPVYGRCKLQRKVMNVQAVAEPLVKSTSANYRGVRSRCGSWKCSCCSSRSCQGQGSGRHTQNGEYASIAVSTKFWHFSNNIMHGSSASS